MKKEDGVTVISLIIYIGALLIIAVIIGRITSFFYNNVMDIQEDTSYSNVYSKINLSLLTLIEDEDLAGIEFGNFERDGEYYIFEENENEDDSCSAIRIIINDGDEKKVKTIGLVGNQLYYDKTLLGEDVERFSFSNNVKNSEDKITYTMDLDVRIGQENYNHTYTAVVE